MASLEYLTQNSLIAYPFKGRVAVSTNNPNPIQDDWFLDILFISYVDNIRNVYISKLEKTLTGELRITFSNGETLQELLQNAITLPSSELVDHLYNSSKSFASYSCEDFAVKFVFGAGLIGKEAFTQIYTLEEAELASAAVILRTPDIDNLTFESYDNRTQLNPTGLVKNYTPIDDIPKVKPRYNSTFTSTGINEGRLDVSSGAGEGLYNNCPDPSENVFSLNSVDPDSSGALFLKTSPCYTANVLVNNDVPIYGQALEKYRNFVTHMSSDPADDVLFDAVSPQHSFIIENFCKPKCPPENMAAFAYYLNRVADGVIELDKIAAIDKETQGKGNVDADVFYASSFCVANNPFIRCLDADTGTSTIPCGTSFVKYFHEGRTLQLFYDNITIREYTIIEVVNDNAIRLSSAPTVADGELFFRVIDNGVMSNMNCAISTYNKEAESFSSVYFKVKYTTAESFNENGEYSTYFAVTLAVFNPSPYVVTVSAEFITSLTKQGNYKIRTQEGIEISNTPAVTLPCRGYAFIEVVFYIPCGQQAGDLYVNLYNTTNSPSVKIGETFVVTNITGAPCKDTTLTDTKIIRLLDYNFTTFNHEINVDPGTISINVTTPSNMPDWMNLIYNAALQKITLSPKSGYTAPTTSKINTFIYHQQAGTVRTSTTVVIDYVAKPSITFPLSSKYTILNPLIAAKNVEYSLTSPLIQTTAKNMSRLGNNFPSDPPLYFYTLTGVLPQGLSFNSTNGSIVGQVGSSIPDGTIYNLTIGASNPAGLALPAQALYIAVNSVYLPTIAFQNPPIANIFNIDNTVTYTAPSPVYTLITTGNPSLYKLTNQSNLPAGLSFNQATGKITGKATAASNQSNVFVLTAENSRGGSNSLTFQLNYTAYLRPVIVSPAQNIIVNGFTTVGTTLQYPLVTVVATQMFGGTNNFDPRLTNITRNKYTALNLPAGLYIDEYTGKIYGTLSPSVYGDNLANTIITRAILVTATNAVGVSEPTLKMTLFFSTLPIPVITGITPNTVYAVIKGNTYTENNYFLQLTASNNPTSYTASNLPIGLTCSTGGKITGEVSTSLPAAEYLVELTASNNAGTSSVVPINVVVPISIISPVEADTIFGDPTVTYTLENPLLTIVTSGIAGQSSGIIYSTSVLPAGFTLSGNKIIGKASTFINQAINLTATAPGSLGSDTVAINVIINQYVTLTGEITAASVPDGIVVRAQNILNPQYFYTTVIDNSYVFEDLPVGDYSVVVNPENHEDYDIYYGFTPAEYDINLSGDTTADFIAIRYRSVSGVITIGENVYTKPFAGVKVAATTSLFTYTANNGTYTLYRLTEGEAYNITPSVETDGVVFTPANISFENILSDISGANFYIPPDVPVITEVVSNNSNGEFNFSIAFTSILPITKLNYKFIEANNFGAGNMVTITNPPVDENNNLNLQFTNKTQGVTYRLAITLISQGGEAEFIGDYVSNGTPSIAPTLLSVTHWTTYGTAIISYSTTRNAVGYGESMATSLLFEITSNDNDGQVVTREYITGLTDIGEAAEMTARLDLDLADFYPENIKYVKMYLVNAFGRSPASGTQEGYAARAPGPMTISNVLFHRNTIAETTTLYMSADITRSPMRSLEEGEYFMWECAGESGIANIRDKYIYLNSMTEQDISSVRVRGYNGYTGMFGQYSESVTGAFTTNMGAEPVEFTLTATEYALVAVYQPAIINNGTAIVNYQMSSDNGATWQILPDNSTNTATVAVAYAGQLYSLAIKAFNGFYDDQMRDYQTKTVIAAYMPPAPYITSLAISDARNPLNNAPQIIINFNPPISDNGSTIINYVYSTDYGVTYIDMDPLDITSPLVISKQSNGIALDNGRTYGIILKAVNAIGRGLSSPVESITLPQGPPGEISFWVEPTMSSFRLSSATATWAPSYNGGAPITSVFAAVTRTDLWDTSTAQWISIGTPLQIITSNSGFGNLITGERYTIALKGYNSFGEGNISFQERILLPVPGASSVSVYQETTNGVRSILGVAKYPTKFANGLLVLDDGGLPLTWFETSIDGGTTWTTGKTRILDFYPSAVASLNNLYFEISGLPPATYRVGIRFLNAAGPGLPAFAPLLPVI
jgi:hypothetical protein